MKNLKIREINSFLLYWKDYEYIKEIEENLNGKLKSAIEPLQREELYYLLLLFRIKKYQNHTVLLEKNLIEYKKIVRAWLIAFQTKKEIKDSNKLKLIFLKTVLSHIAQLRYQSIYFENEFSNWIKYFENELKMEYYKTIWDYYQIGKQLLYKYIVWYGVWYRQIFYSTMFTWIFFAFVYFLYDFIVWNWDLIIWVSEFEWKLLWTFDYYLYLSINILSNLWADWALATTPFLKFLFWVEQVVWVMFFWIFAFMIWKKI